MKLARAGMGIAAVVLLFGGYLAAMAASFNGTIAEYTHKIDQPAIRALATFILLGSIILAFIPEKDVHPQASAEEGHE
jgi:hypothetical protein